MELFDLQSAFRIVAFVCVFSLFQPKQKLLLPDISGFDRLVIEHQSSVLLDAPVSVTTQAQEFIVDYEPNMASWKVRLCAGPECIETSAELKCNNLSIALVDTVPLPASPKLVHNETHYTPVLFNNQFWYLSNSTVNETQINVSFSVMPVWQYQLYSQLDQSFKMQASITPGSEVDRIKNILRDTNPILLGITIAVSILHSLFDFLAFKNDVAFWRNKKDMVGLSFRTLILNIIQQVIILMYLMDNDTSTMILVSSGIGLLIDMWKINKTVIVSSQRSFPFFKMVDRVKPTKLVAKTQEYDELAFTYLKYLLFPLLVGYACWSYIYETHKSNYSFVVSTLVGFVYMFGFISMTPQLFINYKLKSVAHMPWKTFLYKALNTFVDDLFAFVIKMPWLHRIACLRDDLVFFVYLYQRYKYPIDNKRRNEFGQVGDDDECEEEELIDADAKSLKVIKPAPTSVQDVSVKSQAKKQKKETKKSK